MLVHSSIYIFCHLARGNGSVYATGCVSVCGTKRLNGSSYTGTRVTTEKGWDPDSSVEKTLDFDNFQMAVIFSFRFTLTSAFGHYQSTPP